MDKWYYREEEKYVILILGWTVPWRTLMEKLCCLIALVLQQLSGTSITNYYYHQTLWLSYLSWLYTCPKSSRFELKTCLLLTFQRCLNQRECTLTGPAEDSVLFNNFFSDNSVTLLVETGPRGQSLDKLASSFCWSSVLSVPVISWTINSHSPGTHSCQ